MFRKGQDFEARLARRLDLASQPENVGEDLITADYILLGLVTIVVPAILMIVGWQL